jgi:hypothetical protein
MDLSEVLELLTPTQQRSILAHARQLAKTNLAAPGDQPDKSRKPLPPSEKGTAPTLQGVRERLSEMHPSGWENRMQTTWGGNWYPQERKGSEGLNRLGAVNTVVWMFPVANDTAPQVLVSMCCQVEYNLEHGPYRNTV